MFNPETISLPSSSGVYKFFNRDQELIYIGKSKNIKKRVSSYFRKQAHANRKLRKLVSEIQDIKYTITNTEYDALLLENSLIKKNQPKYNILLKDGKTYPYLCITKEPFPRIISTRKYIPQHGEYFGPYTNVVSMNNMLDLLHRLYNIRSCSFALSKKNIEEKKIKICLEYHIGNCKGPCVGLQSQINYDRDMESAKHILKGNFSAVSKHLENIMEISSSNLEFEKAALYKNKLDLLQTFQDQSSVVNQKNTEIDVITIASSSERAFVNYMKITEGMITSSEDKEIIKKIDEPDETILSYLTQEMREKHHSSNKIILSNKPIATTSEETKNIVPQIGDKKKLVSLSLKNAWYQQKIWETKKNQQKIAKGGVLAQLQQDLFLKDTPHVIECFDISNIHGSFPVASMVCFVNGIPKKSHYRHYNIKTVIGPNDFASMQEVVFRRYSRLIKENQSLPDLIIVDGGKGQLSVACEALNKLGLHRKIQVIGIAKKLEEIYRPNDSIPLHIDRKSPSLLLIQKIRNEAHRFAVSFHRLKRSKGAIVPELKTISGIGDASIIKLLARFKSWKKIKGASLTELKEVIGKQKATLLVETLHKQE